MKLNPMWEDYQVLGARNEIFEFVPQRKKTKYLFICRNK